MSKTLGSILSTVGTVALGVGLAATGLGAIALPGLAGSLSVFGVGAGTLGAIGAGLSAVGGLLSRPSAPKAEQTETAIKNPVSPCASGYGTQRMFIDYALYVTADDGTAIDVGAFHDGRVAAIIGHYLGDQKVTLTAGGFVIGDANGQFGDNDDNVQIGTTLGPAVNTAFATVIAKIPDRWTVNHRGDGVVTGFAMWKAVKTKNYQKIYSGGGPNNQPLSLVMQLQPVFDWRDPSQSVTDPLTWKWSENFILHTAHYLLVRDNKDWAKHFAPTLAYWTAAANDADSLIPLKGVQTVLTAKANDGATSIAVASTSGLAAGMFITISATGNTSLTETRTVSSVSGLTIAFSGGLANDHQIGSQVTWASSEMAPATEPRYRSCVVHKHTDEHKAVIGSLLACGDGWMTERADGALVVYSGAYYEPTVTVTDDDIISISDQDGVEEENAVNQIPITYISANHDYSAVDTDAWTDEDDISARGKILASSGLANQVPSHSQARRLAKRSYAETMAARRGTALLRQSGSKIIGERYIRIASRDANLDIAVQVKAPVKRDPITGQVSFAWILADPNVDSWNPATEEGDPAPVGNRVATLPLEAPTITSVTPTYGQDTAYNTPGVKLTLVVAGPTRDDLIWFVRTRPVGGVSWLEQQYPDVDAGSSVTLETNFLPLAELEVEVAYQTGDGRLSPYGSETTNTDVQTPGPVTNLSVSGESPIFGDWQAAVAASSYRVDIIVEGS